MRGKCISLYGETKNGRYPEESVNEPLNFRLVLKNGILSAVSRAHISDKYVAASNESVESFIQLYIRETSKRANDRSNLN